MIDGRELERRCVEARAVRRADAWRHVEGLCEAIEELRVERRALVAFLAAVQDGSYEEQMRAMDELDRLGLVP